MRINTYIGNGEYCYANSASMLLASIDEKVSPSVIEVLCGVGLSAFWMEKTNLLFFNFALPDEELTRTFNILGFDCKERIIIKKKPAPIEKLKKDLSNSPVLLGPVDMGYLNYNPNHGFLYGSDHYIFIYGFEDANFYLHDPEKFPCVFLSQAQLKKSWESDKIFYGLENYRYWTLPKRIKSPTKEDIYDSAIEDFKSIYRNCDKKSLKNNWTTGKEAILKAAVRFENKDFTQGEIDHLRYFALPLGAKRALDFATFLAERSPKLAELKSEQARLFGKGHSLVVAKDWRAFSKALREYAEVEEKFKNLLLG